MTVSHPPARNVRGHLLRIFGLGFGFAVVVGGVIGSGILRNPSVVAAGFLDPKSILLAWLGGGLFVAVDAMPTVELGAAIPRSGGPSLSPFAPSDHLPAFLWAGRTGCSLSFLPASSRWPSANRFSA